jgi:hypothetical protein
MQATQADKVREFRALHEGPGTFVIPNPWDVGTARLFSQLGFRALATTSAGLAFSLGLPDGRGVLSREIVLAHEIQPCSSSRTLKEDFGAPLPPSAPAESRGTKPSSINWSPATAIGRQWQPHPGRG